MTNHIAKGEIYTWDFEHKYSKQLVRDKLLLFVCIEFNVQTESILRPGGKRVVNDAKKAYVMIARDIIKDTYQRIGMSLCRHHSDIIHLHKAGVALASLRNDAFAAHVENVKKQILKEM